MSSPSTFLPNTHRDTNMPHVWSHEEKLVLCVLERFFASENETASRVTNIAAYDRRQVMMSYFPGSFPTYMKANVFFTQFNDMRMKQPSVYEQVFSPLFASSKIKWLQLQDRIRSVAEECGVTLHSVDQNGNAITNLTSSPRHKRSRGNGSDSLEDINRFAYVTEPKRQLLRITPTPPRTPKRLRLDTIQVESSKTPRSTVSQLLTPPPTTHKSIRQPALRNSRIPPVELQGTLSRGLAFRFQDGKSHTLAVPGGFRAGAFAGKPLLPPPAFAPSKFGMEAEKQLRPLLVPVRDCKMHYLTH